jgi:hypothetical protein
VLVHEQRHATMVWLPSERIREHGDAPMGPSESEDERDDAQLGFWNPVERRQALLIESFSCNIAAYAVPEGVRCKDRRVADVSLGAAAAVALFAAPRDQAL